MTACSVIPDVTQRPNPDSRTRSSLFFLFLFFLKSFQIMKIQLLFEIHFKYSMKKYIYVNTTLTYKDPSFVQNSHFCSIWHYMPFCYISRLLYNAALLVVFNNQIFIKQNQSSIFIIVFLQNESNNFMYACDKDLLILCVTLTMTVIHYGLRPRTCSIGSYVMIKTTR